MPRVALIQMASTGDLDHNIRQAESYLKKAKQDFCFKKLRYYSFNFNHLNHFVDSFIQIDSID